MSNAGTIKDNKHYMNEMIVYSLHYAISYLNIRPFVTNSCCLSQMFGNPRNNM